MRDRRRPVDVVALELAALRIEHDLQANLITRMADLLYLPPAERHVLHELRALIEETAAFAATHAPHG